MRLIADAHISPRTVEFLRSLGHDILRVGEQLPPDTPDELLAATARSDQRVVLTQDLDLSSIIALRDEDGPSVITLRLASSRIEYVNSILQRVLPSIEQDVLTGSLITVEDQRVRRRTLPRS